MVAVKITWSDKYKDIYIKVYGVDVLIPNDVRISRWSSVRSKEDITRGDSDSELQHFIIYNESDYDDDKGKCAGIPVPWVLLFVDENVYRSCTLYALYNLKQK